MSEGPIRIAPLWWWVPACLAAMMLGIALAWLVPDPFAGVGPGERPVKWLLWLKAGAGVLAAAALYRLTRLKWLRLDGDGVQVAGLLGRRGFRWGDLRHFAPEGDTLRLQFAHRPFRLPVREYAPADIATFKAFVAARSSNDR